MKDLLNNLFYDVKNNNNNMYVFLIGCYPSYSIYHEMPPFINNYNNEYNITLILIDPLYENTENLNVCNTIFKKEINKDYYTSDNNLKLYLYNNLINNYDYGRILCFTDFCSINNIISFIFEYTSKIRYNYKTFQYIDSVSKTWISYSNCLADMDEKKNNPVIENNNVYDVSIFSNLYNEYEINSNINSEKSNKRCEYILSNIIQFLDDLEILLSMRSYVKLKLQYNNGNKIELNYNKNENWENDKNYLLYRLNGYFNNIHEKILEYFEKSNYNDLLSYIDSIITNFFMEIYKILFDLNKINFDNIENLMFDTNDDCRRIIDFYKNKLSDYEIPKEVSVI